MKIRASIAVLCTGLYACSSLASNSPSSEQQSKWYSIYDAQLQAKHILDGTRKIKNNHSFWTDSATKIALFYGDVRHRYHSKDHKGSFLNLLDHTDKDIGDEVLITDTIPKSASFPRDFPPENYGSIVGKSKNGFLCVRLAGNKGAELIIAKEKLSKNIGMFYRDRDNFIFFRGNKVFRLGEQTAGIISGIYPLPVEAAQATEGGELVLMLARVHYAGKDRLIPLEELEIIF